MSKKRSTNVPEQYQQLAKRGQRVRFNGFWLNESERDRTIATWIDETPGAATIIKDMIYSCISGNNTRPAIHHPVAVDPTATIGDAGAALLDLDD